MKKIFIVLILILAAFAAGFFLSKIRPGPKETTKIVYRDKIISGNMSGSALISSQKPKIDLQGSQNNVMVNRTNISQGQNPGTNQGDFKANVPVTGEIKTSHVDLKFTGLTTVEKNGDNLTVNTVFDPNVTETLTLDQQKPKTWHIGLDAVTNFDRVGIGGYVQKDFWTWQGLTAYGRVELDYDTRIKAGIEYSF